MRHRSPPFALESQTRRFTAGRELRGSPASRCNVSPSRAEDKTCIPLIRCQNRHFRLGSLMLPQWDILSTALPLPTSYIGAIENRSRAVEQPPEGKWAWVFKSGALGLCPRCGKGHMFKSWLKVADTCEV